MTAHRLHIATLAIVAALLPALLGSSCNQPDSPECAIPSPAEVSTDGGPDPCHCDPPPSLNIQACPCSSGNSAQLDIYAACLAIYRNEVDAGAE